VDFLGAKANVKYLAAICGQDTLADPGDTATLLTQLNSRRKPISRKSRRRRRTRLHCSTSRLVSFASDFVTAVSPANRSKLEQAITAMIKAC
jgi:hypothetical protein